jgi:Protein of unknown function (DUF3071)
MQELRLVAVSEDGSYAVLVVPGRSGRFALPIDERLRTVARGQFSRLAQYEIEVESPLRPKEIQDRIRAGETAEEIADAAGLPVDRIRRFEGPVLAEREFRAGEAQRATVRAPGASGLGRRLGEVVAERLADIGASTEDQEWDSRKRPDGNWQVQLAYTVAGRMRMAEWVFDPRSKHVTPDDDEAVRLCLDESDWPPSRPEPAVVKATVTPITSRAANSHPSEHRGDFDRPGGSRNIVHPSRSAPAAVTSTVGAPQPVSQVSQPLAHVGQADPVAQVNQAEQAGGNQRGNDQRGDQLRREHRSPDERAAPARRATGQPTTDQGTADEPDLDRPQADAPDQGQTDQGQTDSGQPDNEAAPPAAVQEQAAEPPVRPGKRASGGRSRRSSVPSWDEIMFGNSRQPD